MSARTATKETTSETKPPERKLSFGEEVFDFVVYKGIGFGVNEGISLYLTDEFEHGMGKPLFDKWSDALVKKYPQRFKDTFENGVLKATGKQNAANLLMSLMLLNGGTLLLGPMLHLDKHKGGIVEWINHNFDSKGKTPEEIKARDEEVRQAIACEPRQSLKSMLPARVLAVSSTVAFGSLIMGAKRNNWVKDQTREAITGAMKNMGGHAEESALVKLAENEKFKRYAGLSGVEAIYCAISSFVLEKTSKFFAGKKKTVRNEEVCKADPLAPEAVDAAGNDHMPQGREEKPAHAISAHTAEADAAQLKPRAVRKDKPHPRMHGSHSDSIAMRRDSAEAISPSL